MEITKITAAGRHDHRNVENIMPTRYISMYRGGTGCRKKIPRADAANE